MLITKGRSRRAVLAIAVCAGLLLAGAAWSGGRAWTAREHLTEAATLLRRLQNQVQSRDLESARTTLAALRDRTTSARSATAGLDWRLGSRLPAVGEDIDAVRTASTVLDDLAQRVLPDLLETAGGGTVGSLVPSEGRFDLRGLRAAAPRIAAADVAARQARDRMATIRAADLAPQLRTAVAELAAGVDRLVAVTGSAARAAALLPSLLGLDGPRTYLMIFQNPAEVRASGGMPGAFAVVRAELGAVRIVDQGSASADLRAFDRPVLPLDAAMRALYTDRLGLFPADVNLTPHFPTTALLIREMYRRRTGTVVDGVLSADPVALSYLLRATGPVPMPTGPPLTAETAVRALLADSYAKLTGPGSSDTRAKERYFAAAAKTVFETLSRGDLDPGAALAALARATGERRLLLWSAHASEQKVIRGTTLEGVLPLQDGVDPTVGVFLNDGSGAKLGVYLSGAAHLSAAGCLADGRRELRLRITLASDAPASGLPAYVLGGLGLTADPYTVRTQVLVFSPAGGSLAEMWLDGARTRFGAGTERQRSVGVLTVDLGPGQRRVIEATVLTGVPPTAAPSPRSSVQPRLWLTPMVNPWRITTDSSAFCGRDE